MKANSVIKSLLLVSLFTFIPAEGHAQEVNKEIKVEYVNPARGLNVRINPDVDSKKVTALPVGTKIEILDNKTTNSKTYKEWSKIKLSNNKQGWVCSDYLSEDKPVVKKTAEIETTKVTTETNVESVKSEQTEVIQAQEVASYSGRAMNMTLSFYGDGAGENGGYAGQTASGAPLSFGVVASNAYPFGTKFVINGNTYTVLDRGGASHFDNPNRLDVFVPRQAGEGDDAYEARMLELGKQTVTAYIQN